MRTAVVLVAGLSAVGLALAGCSSTRGPNGGSSPLPGITADSVKVGFTIVDLGSLELGFEKADYGGVSGQTKAVNAVVDYVNAHGGMGGRKVEPVIKPYVGKNDSPVASQAQCSSYTQDERVFAVVMDGQLQNNGVPCYVAARTILVDQTLIAHDAAQFKANSPFLWSATHPEYGGFVKAELEAMREGGFFDGARGVLIMPADTEVARRVTDTIVKPYVTNLGIAKSAVSFVDSTNLGTLELTSVAAVNKGKADGLDRVVVIGGARIEPVVISTEAAGSYPSRWGISTFDNPQFSELNPSYVNTPLLSGQVGLGYSAFQDVSLAEEPPLPDPSNPAQVLCHSILTEAGATPPAGLRQNWAPAMQYCDGAMFLKAVLDQAPKGGAVSGDEFKDAAGRIGSTYRSASTLGSQWGPGVYAGTNAGRRIAWDDGCACYRYQGELLRFGSTIAPAQAVPLETITVTP